MSVSALQTQCCVCRRVRRGMGWKHTAAGAGNGYSHSYCPTCLRTELARLEGFRSAIAGRSAAVGAP